MEPLIYESARARLVVDTQAGGRLASLSVDGHELLVDRNDDPLMWGAYPMVPFAGRIRFGRFTFDGTTYELPTNAPPHAMHGYGFAEPWDRIDDQTIHWTFGEPWPFVGSATQRHDLGDDMLTITMCAVAAEPQPMVLGLHPWFRRVNTAGSLTFELARAAMYRRDELSIPDGTLTPAPPGPWDDCFCQLDADPTLRWGDLEVRLSASSDHWVVYDMADHAVCVEPQTGPPDAFTISPKRLDRGESLTLTFTLDWSS